MHLLWFAVVLSMMSRDNRSGNIAELLQVVAVLDVLNKSSGDIQIYINVGSVIT